MQEERLTRETGHVLDKVMYVYTKGSQSPKGLKVKKGTYFSRESMKSWLNGREYRIMRKVIQKQGLTLENGFIPGTGEGTHNGEARNSTGEGTHSWEDTVCLTLEYGLIIAAGIERDKQERSK